MPFEGQTNPWSLICPCRWKSWPQRKAVTVAPGCWRSRSLSIYSDFSPWILLRRQLGCQSWQGSQTVRWSAQRSFFWRRRSAPISAQCHMIPYEFCICCDLIPSEFATSSGQMLAWFRAWHIEVGGSEAFVFLSFSVILFRFLRYVQDFFHVEIADPSSHFVDFFHRTFELSNSVSRWYQSRCSCLNAGKWQQDFCEAKADVLKEVCC